MNAAQQFKSQLKRLLLPAVALMAAVAFSIGSPQPAAAQGNARVAFLNSASQLVVSDTTGNFRWVVTNPGEYLALPLGYTWSPDGTRLFFALDLGGEVSLRVADVNTQQVVEIGRTQSGATGGEWRGENAVLVTRPNQALVEFSVNGGENVVSDLSAVVSPFSAERPALAPARTLSPNGQNGLVASASGSFALLNGAAIPSLFAANSANGAGGLWNDDSSLVAYSGTGADGTAALVVSNVESGASVALASARATPLPPLAWISDTDTLIFRADDGVARAADFSCLRSACGGDPFATSPIVAPATASDVQTGGGVIAFADGQTIYGVDASCIASITCLENQVSIGAQAVPGLTFDLVENRLVYTAYTSNPNDPNDHAVAVVDVQCVSAGACSPSVLLNGADAGLLSPDENAVTVEGAGVGLAILDLNTGTTANLTDYSGGQLLPYTRWNGG